MHPGQMLCEVEPRTGGSLQTQLRALRAVKRKHDYEGEHIIKKHVVRIETFLKTIDMSSQLSLAIHYCLSMACSVLWMKHQPHTTEPLIVFIAGSKSDVSADVRASPCAFSSSTLLIANNNRNEHYSESPGAHLCLAGAKDERERK